MMAGFFDSIESSFNSLLEPLTSGLVAETTTSAKTSASAVSASRTTTIASSARTTSAVSSSSSKSPSTSTTASTSSKPSKSSSSSETSSTTESSSSSQTTFSTITTSTSFETSSTASISSTASAETTPAAPVASSTQTASASTSHKDSGSGISTAGIAVAAVLGVALIASVIYLTLRFCPAIRKRLDAFYQHRRDERSYREALDGPSVPKKDERYSLDSSIRSRTDSGPKSIEYEKARISMAAAKELNLPQRPLSSFFALGRNPNIQAGLPANQPERQRNTRFSWEAQDNPRQRETVHQPYSSPNSAEPEVLRDQGLGLGRVSLLRNHSLLRKAGYDVPPKLPGPHMTAAQAEIATAGAVRIMPGKKEASSPIRTLELIKPVQQQGIKRKPVGGAPHAASMVKSQPIVERERSQSPPRLNIDIPSTPASQIGMAVSGTPRSTQGGYVG